MQKLLFVLIATLSLTLNANAEGDRANDATLSFGIVPQHAAQRLASQWQPVLDYLAAKTGTKLAFKTAPNIPEFEKRLNAGEYDVAYMNPYHFTVFNQHPGYKAIAHEKDERLIGIIVVAKESPYQTIQDLNGLTIAFPAPAAFAASVLPRAELTSKQIAFTAKYVSTHDSVYLTVAKGLYAAGGGINRSLQSMPSEIQQKLRILWTSPGYTPHAIASSPTLDPDIAKRLQNALINMNENPAGQALLAHLEMAGFSAAKDSDWDDVKSLGVELLRELQKAP